MAMYSISELKNKMGGGSKKELRLFEPKVGKLYNIWIPKDTFLYIKKHFNIQNVPYSKHCRIKAITCINSDLGKPPVRCPICEYKEILWAKWRETESKKEQKEIQNKINSLTSDQIYVNAIDTDDSDLKFEAFRLTKGMMDSLELATQVTPIESIIWQFKKNKSGTKVDYTFLESVGHPKAIELCKEYDDLASRDFADGGLIDLETTFSYEVDEKKYLKFLKGNSDENDEEEDLLDEDENETISRPKRNTKKPKVVVEDVDVSLDELDLDEEPEEKPNSKKVSKKEDEIDDDDIDLDDLEIEDIEDEEEKVTVDANVLKERRNEKVFVELVLNKLAADKKIKLGDDYVKNFKAAYSYLKTKKTSIEINQTEIDIPF